MKYIPKVLDDINVTRVLLHSNETCIHMKFSISEGL